MHTICLNVLGSIRCPSNKWPLNQTVGADLSLRVNDGPILIAEEKSPLDSGHRGEFDVVVIMYIPIYHAANTAKN
jgi:hypothetical protein